MNKQNRYRVNFDMGISPYHWTEYVNARSELGAVQAARKVFHLNGKPIGWIHNVELLEEGTR